MLKEPLLETEPLCLTKRLFIDIRMFEMKGFPLLFGTLDYLYDKIFFECLPLFLFLILILILNGQCFWLTSLLRLWGRRLIYCHSLSPFCRVVFNTFIVLPRSFLAD